MALAVPVWTTIKYAVLGGANSKRWLVLCTKSVQYAGYFYALRTWPDTKKPQSVILGAVTLIPL
jgi:hypothetical protein